MRAYAKKQARADPPSLYYVGIMLVCLKEHISIILSVIFSQGAQQEKLMILLLESAVLDFFTDVSL